MNTRLPVVGSTAATTSFCHERVDGPGGLHLYLDGNGKITASNGTLDAPKPNAFSLRNVDDCPQSTPTCRAACYVENLRAAQPALYELYEHNASAIRTILADPALEADWAARFAAVITWHCEGGFRWHVSGDVFSLDYARWIASVVRQSPGVRHWIYTRSFMYLEPLLNVSTLRGGNLAVNLSCDVDNYAAAQRVRTSYLSAHTRGVLRLCYLTVDGVVPPGLGSDDVLFPDYKLRPRQYATLAESPWWQDLTPEQRGTVCPVDAHGKSEKRRCGIPDDGNCSRCVS